MAKEGRDVGVDTMSSPGRAIGRDIAAGEAVEHELDAFICRRYEQRRKSEPEREAEAAWGAAEKRQEAARRRENRAGWYGARSPRRALRAIVAGARGHRGGTDGSNRRKEKRMNKLEQLKVRKADLGRKIERIRADRDYNEGAKAQRIAPLYSRFKAEERRVLDEVRADTAQAAASRGRKAFGAPTMPGADKALVAMSYRHALDSVEGISDPKDLDAAWSVPC